MIFAFSGLKKRWGGGNHSRVSCLGSPLFSWPPPPDHCYSVSTSRYIVYQYQVISQGQSFKYKPPPPFIVSLQSGNVCSHCPEIDTVKEAWWQLPQRHWQEATELRFLVIHLNVNKPECVWHPCLWAQQVGHLPLLPPLLLPPLLLPPTLLPLPLLLLGDATHGATIWTSVSPAQGLRETPRTSLSHDFHVTLPLVTFPYEISYILVNKTARTGTTSLGGGQAWKSLGAKLSQYESGQPRTVSVHKGHEPSFDLLRPRAPRCCLTKVGLTPLQKGKQNCDFFF